MAAGDKETIVRLALYQPDIPQNAGSILRLAACLGVGVDIIEPCGFVLSEPRLRRAGMDYIGLAEMARHTSWERFLADRAAPAAASRLVLLTTAADTALPDFRFQATDTLLLGRETAGVPPEVHARADARVRVPMRRGLRSLNVAIAAAIALYEALRQTGGLPDA